MTLFQKFHSEKRFQKALSIIYVTSISNSEQKTNYLTNKKMLIVINYSHLGFTWRIKSHEELKETAFFFFMSEKRWF